MSADFPSPEHVDGTRAKPRAYSLYPQDVDLIRWMGEEMGCSASEVVRTAVRHMALSYEKVSLLRAAS